MIKSKLRLSTFSFDITVKIINSHPWKSAAYEMSLVSYKLRFFSVHFCTNEVSQTHKRLLKKDVNYLLVEVQPWISIEILMKEAANIRWDIDGHVKLSRNYDFTCRLPYHTVSSTLDHVNESTCLQPI